jgi:hypothetical protein
MYLTAQIAGNDYEIMAVWQNSRIQMRHWLSGISSEFKLFANVGIFGFSTLRVNERHWGKGAVYIAAKFFCILKIEFSPYLILMNRHPFR